MKHLKNKFKLGFSSLEILMSIGIFFIFTFSVIGTLLYSQNSTVKSTYNISATLLAQEGLEAVKNIRDYDFGSITEGTYALTINANNNWELTSGTEAIGEFTRSITITKIDDTTYEIESNVSWDKGGTNSGNVSLTSILTNWTSSLGSEVGQAGGGRSDWCDPSLTILDLDLPGNGISTSITASEGIAFAGTGGNSSGYSFMEVGITDETPPVLTLEGYADGYKTNDVFTDGEYFYISTDTNSKEVVILDPNDNYNEIGYFDAPGNLDGEAMFVRGDVGYVVQDTRLRTFDLSSKTGSRPQMDDVRLYGFGKDIVVSGDYAFIALAYNWYEFKIIDISDPYNIYQINQKHVGFNEGTALAVNPSRTHAYMTSTYSNWGYEFVILDISDKTGYISIVGEYNTSGMSPKGVRVFPGEVGVIGGVGGEEYQVLDISNPENINYCGGLDLGVGINALDSVFEIDNDAYTYLMTRDSTGEFKVVEGGLGGGSGGSGGEDSNVLFIRRE